MLKAIRLQACVFLCVAFSHANAAQNEAPTGAHYLRADESEKIVLVSIGFSLLLATSSFNTCRLHCNTLTESTRSACPLVSAIRRSLSIGDRRQDTSQHKRYSRMAERPHKVRGFGALNTGYVLVPELNDPMTQSPDAPPSDSVRQSSRLRNRP